MRILLAGLTAGLSLLDVGTTAFDLVDASRDDPWQPAEKRELMVTMWYPTAVPRPGGRPVVVLSPGFTLPRATPGATGSCGGRVVRTRPAHRQAPRLAVQQGHRHAQDRDASALTATEADDRIDAGVNLDGTFFDRLPATGLTKPFLMLGTQRLHHAFIDRHLRGRSGSLLDGPAERYPEVHPQP